MIKKLIIVITDVIMINIAFFLICFFRFRSGFIDNPITLTIRGMLLSGLVLTVMWLILFTFFGLYHSKSGVSRLDEIISILKAVTAGAILLFIQSFDPHNPLPSTRVILYSYWVMMIVFPGAGRIAIRTIERNRLQRGLGHRNAVIIGTGAKACSVKKKIELYPSIGFRVSGFIQHKKKVNPEIQEEEILGTVKEIKNCIREKNIEEVIIAVENIKSSEMAVIIDQCNGESVTIRAVSDIYDIASGRSRTRMIHGIPFVEIFPDKMKPWERSAKRLIDILVSFCILFLFFPIWVFIGFLIKITSRGPVFYKQKRVGLKGKVFTMFKFRSMIKDAEKQTGPVLIDGSDSRITKVGSIIRKLRIDEIPQFINVLEGDMSLVGPRPERPYFVEKFRDKIPLYTRRLSVRPGITGWAQIKQTYESSVKDITKKLEYDLFYIQNMSFQLDLNILLRTIVIMFRRRGK